MSKKEGLKEEMEYIEDLYSMLRENNEGLGISVTPSLSPLLLPLFSSF